MTSTSRQTYQPFLDGFQQALSVRHDAAAVAQLYAQDAVLVDVSSGRRFQGREAISQWYATFLRAFPDLTAEYANVFGSGEYVAIEFIGRGTHQGPLAGPQGEIPPTGQRVEFKGCCIGRVNPQGEFTEDHTYLDSASIMQQLGLA